MIPIPTQIIITNPLFPTQSTDLIITGASAGSLGAQVWSDQMLTQLKGSLGWERAAIIADSYVGVFPEGSQGPTMTDFGVCDSGVLDDMPELQELCDQDVLTLQDMSSTSMSRHPDVPFAWIQSKADIVQKLYYDAIGLTIEMEIDAIDSSKFAGDMNDIYQGYTASGNDNAVSYLVDSLMHTYTLMDMVYHATSEGKKYWKILHEVRILYVF